MLLHITAVLLFLSTAITFHAQATPNKNIDELLNWCLDSRSHKSKPGPEAGLYKQCSPWKERSCCTANTTVDSHYKDAYNLNWNHCSEKKNLSSDCRRHFIQDLCFYECSPNVGPWVKKVNNKFRTEKFFHVPLCARDCDAWFKACENDYTCVDNWGLDFVWNNGKNVCPAGKECKTYLEVFKSAKNFCEKVWNYSWMYTENDKPCMTMWFDGNENPNTPVAKLMAQEIVSSISTKGLLGNVLVVAASVFLTYIQYTVCL